MLSIGLYARLQANMTAITILQRRIYYSIEYTSPIKHETTGNQ